MHYNLKPRKLLFAKNVRQFLHNLPRSFITVEDAKQLTRSSGSIGANYIEAAEAVSKKDALLRIKISKKEAQETVYWLELLETQAINQHEEWASLLREAKELVLILSAIIRKLQSP